MAEVKVTAPGAKEMLRQYREQSAPAMVEQVKGLKQLAAADRLELMFYILLHQSAIMQGQQATIAMLRDQAAPKRSGLIDVSGRRMDA